MKCSNCGGEHTTNFCPNCGTPIQTDCAQQQNRPQTQPPVASSQPSKKKGCLLVFIIVSGVLIFGFVFLAAISILLGKKKVESSNTQSHGSAVVQSGEIQSGIVSVAETNDISDLLSIEIAHAAAETYIRSSGPSADWVVGKNTEYNAVIVELKYNDYYIDATAITQKDLDQWSEFTQLIVENNKACKEAMDKTGYEADCIFYVYDKALPNSTLLMVKNGTIQKDYLANASDGHITLEEFNDVKTGMSYSQVIKIIGGEGELISSVDLDIGTEYETQMYVWYAPDGLGNANITFQGGSVIAKAQFGLE